MSAFEWDKPTADQLAARKRWVELLRSGKYEQLKGYLATEDGTKRCCLGVACDPVVTGIELEWKPRDGDEEWDVRAYYNTPDGFGQAIQLPALISVALGLIHTSPLVRLEDERAAHLANLNDNGYAFPEIADLIEATYITPHEQVSA